MTLERAGAAALIGGTLAMLGVMALHPSGVPHNADAKSIILLAIVVHGVAIAGAPVLVFGMFALTRSIGFAKPVPALAFFFYLFGAIAVMLAATMSGLVAPRLIEATMTATTDKDLLHGLLKLEWYLNQSFATVHVALFSAAITLYALAWPDRGPLAAGVQIVGFLVGIGVFAWLVSGTLTLNVHGMGAVVVLQGAWFVLAGVGLAFRKSAAA